MLITVKKQCLLDGKIVALSGNIENYDILPWNNLNYYG